MTFHDVLDRVRRAIVDACRYQDMPYGYLAKVMHAQQPRQQPQRPLCRVIFNFMPPIPASQLVLHGLQVDPVEAEANRDREALADLSLHIHHKSGALVCRVGYKAGMFSSFWIQELAAQFQTQVTAILDAPASQACVAPAL
jgi:hypothetical protein